MEQKPTNTATSAAGEDQASMKNSASPQLGPDTTKRTAQDDLAPGALTTDVRSQPPRIKLEEDDRSRQARPLAPRAVENGNRLSEQETRRESSEAAAKEQQYATTDAKAMFNDKDALATIKKDVKLGEGSPSSPRERAMRDSELYGQIGDSKMREQARQAIAEGIDKEPRYAVELRAASPEVYNQASSPEPRPAATQQPAAANRNSIREAVAIEPELRSDTVQPAQRAVTEDRSKESKSGAGRQTPRSMSDLEDEAERRAIDSYFVKRGKEFRFQQNTEVVAFTESRMVGRVALTTTHNDNELVVKAMIDRAEDKKWNAIEVSGTPEFKQQVWLEARARGKAVTGYEPSTADLDRLQARIEREEVRAKNVITETRGQSKTTEVSRTESRESVPESSREKPRNFSGQVVDMGNAPYMNKKDEPQSYYVTLRGDDGRDRTVWGKDLERAATAAELRIGDRVANIRRTDTEAVTVTANVRDEKDDVVGKERKVVHLNRWEIQKEQRELSGVEKGLVNELERNAPENLRGQVRAEASRQLDDMAARGLQPRVEIYDARVTAQRTREPRVIEATHPAPSHHH